MGAKSRIIITKLAAIKVDRSSGFLQPLPKAEATHLSQDLQQPHSLGEGQEEEES